MTFKTIENPSISINDERTILTVSWDVVYYRLDIEEKPLFTSVEQTIKPVEISRERQDFPQRMR